MTPSSRTFLFLQGPHGPFFAELARALGHAGGRVLRLGFNAGDRAEWRGGEGYRAYTGTPADLPHHLDALFLCERVTDLVLYGDMRPVHRAAIARARARGLTIHCFEEGYLRPWWITYERGGVNGNSRLMTLPLADMQAALRGAEADLPEAPAHWGAVWAHSLHGMAYHFHVLARNGPYPNFSPHRSLSVGRELALNARRLALRPFLALAARRRLRRLRRSGAVFHLVLLQLAHDSSMLHHSPFRGVAEFARHCLEGFAAGAPRHHRLVFKTHPFDDGREAIEAPVCAVARRLGIADRVMLIHGGKLGPLLDRARSVVTVNSTGGQQALWRGLPVSLHGEAVYDKPEFVSRQPLAEFFAAPPRPDLAAYRDFRRFLIHTSQVRGGFYTAEGRASALRSVVDLMLADADPYERILACTAAGAPRDRLRLVAGE